MFCSKQLLLEFKDLLAIGSSFQESSFILVIEKSVAAQNAKAKFFGPDERGYTKEESSNPAKRQKMTWTVLFLMLTS